MKNAHNQLPSTPAIIYLDMDGLYNHEWADNVASILEEDENNPFGSFRMDALDEFEHRAVKNALKEKNIGRNNHRKHVLHWE
jgi:hypothetical protein